MKFIHVACILYEVAGGNHILGCEMKLSFLIKLFTIYHFIGDPAVWILTSWDLEWSVAPRWRPWRSWASWCWASCSAGPPTTSCPSGGGLIRKLLRNWISDSRNCSGPSPVSTTASTRFSTGWSDLTSKYQMSNSIFVSFKKHNLICSPQDTCSPHSDPVLEAPGPVAGLSPHHQGHRAAPVLGAHRQRWHREPREGDRH